MCFRYSLGKTLEQIREKYEVEIPASPGLFDRIAETLPRYDVNAFTHPQMPVISNDNPHQLSVGEWGLIPHWVKSSADAAKLQKLTLNARTETCFEKPAFRSSIKTRRCLVVADGFYEWMDFQKKKYPHFIHLEKKRIFSFAGIRDEWTDKETGEVRQTFSILTTEANPLMAKIHNKKKRMPLILNPDQEGLWLSPEITQKDLEYVIQNTPDEEMQAYTISSLITSRTENSDTPEVQKHMEYPELILAE